MAGVSNRQGLIACSLVLAGGAVLYAAADAGAPPDPTVWEAVRPQPPPPDPLGSMPEVMLSPGPDYVEQVPAPFASRQYRPLVPSATCSDRNSCEVRFTRTCARTLPARLVPDFHDGATRGFKVFAVLCDGPIDRAGFHNNDVLVRVNGHDLDDTEKALELYAELQDEVHFVVDLLRNEEPLTLTIDL